MGNTTRASGADIVAVALGTTVVTWTIMYLAAFPERGLVPPWLAAALVACSLLAAGYLLGRDAGRRVAGGAGLGVTLTAINLIIMASLLGREAGERLDALWWILGFLAVSVVLCGAGAAAGSLSFDPTRVVGWHGRLATLTVLTTLLMIISGGIVTGLEAGLAVEGWLVVEKDDHLLVLFPPELFQRDAGTYVEHAHRLWGLLVGLATLLLAFVTWRTDDRVWLRWLVLAVVLAVIVQGTLGGTRVTEESVPLAIAHGVFAHVVLAVMAIVAAAASRTWREPPEAPRNTPLGGFGALLIGAVLLQIVVGTAYRHLEPLPELPQAARIAPLHGHSFIGSALVVALVVAAALRVWGRNGDVAVLRRTGAGLLHTTILQVALGIVAFVLVPKAARGEEPIPPLEVAFTTAHQAVGATLLAMATLVVVWTRRLAAPGSQPG